MNKLSENANRRKPAPVESPNLKVALSLAEAGLPVFPCRESGGKGVIKAPYTHNGLKDATTDLDLIHDWWRAHPGALVGLPTGEPSGLAVLDLDLKGGKDGEAALIDMGRLPRSSIVVETPSGGRHLYFSYIPGLRNTTGKLPDGTPVNGVDIRAEGGYVIAPGSSMADGISYLPHRGDILATRLTAWPTDLSPRTHERPANDNLDLADLSLNESAAYLHDMPLTLVDERAVYLDAIFAFADAFGDDARQTVEEWARQSSKFNKRDFKRDWESAFRPYRGDRATLATVIHHARGEWALTRREALELFDDLTPEERAKSSTSHLSFLRPSEIEQVESRRQIVKGLIASGDVGCIVGAPGVGKSLLAPFLCYAVAQGRDVFSLRVRQGLTFYVAAEDQFGMGQRIRALRRQYGEADDFTLVAGVSDLLSRDSRDLKALRRAVKGQRPAVVFVDTLAMAFPGLEENSAEGMGRVMTVARSLTKWGAAVILIHHDTKDGQQGLPRGHSLLNGALDFSLQLKRGDDGIVRGKLTKNRNGTCDLDIAFRIETEVLGEDEDGDEIRAAYADPLEGFSYPARPKLSPQESRALELAKETAGKAPSVNLDDWRDRCVDDGGISDAGDSNSRQRAFRRVRDGLIEKGRISAAGSTVTLLDLATDISPEDFCDGD